MHRLCCWRGCPLLTASQRANVMIVEAITEEEDIHAINKAAIKAYLARK